MKAPEIRKLEDTSGWKKKNIEKGIFTHSLEVEMWKLRKSEN